MQVGPNNGDRIREAIGLFVIDIRIVSDGRFDTRFQNERRRNPHSGTVLRKEQVDRGLNFLFYRLGEGRARSQQADHKQGKFGDQWR